MREVRVLTGFLIALVVGVRVVYTGPTFDEYRARRRYKREGIARLVRDNAACSLCGRRTCRFAVVRAAR